MRGTLKQLGWMALIWALSASALAALSLLIRWALR